MVKKTSFRPNVTKANNSRLTDSTSYLLEVIKGLSDEEFSSLENAGYFAGVISDIKDAVTTRKNEIRLPKNSITK